MIPAQSLTLPSTTMRAPTDSATTIPTSSCAGSSAIKSPMIITITMNTLVVIVCFFLSNGFGSYFKFSHYSSELLMTANPLIRGKPRIVDMSIFNHGEKS
ncbi:MAG: hypothetical protein C4527_20805 [Candidatus Omnitrophota bacterium]|nr:MAG: hypothetical protein C4527_20805 [Candidatus Omnitrophota bacterium]